MGKFFTWVGTQFPAYTISAKKFDLATAPEYDTWAASGTTLQTGSGSNTLRIWSTSLSGSRADSIFSYGRFRDLVGGQPIDLIMFAHSHNEGLIELEDYYGGSFDLSGNVNNGQLQTEQQYMSRTIGVLEQVRMMQPKAPILVTTSNPELSTTADDQDLRYSVLARMCSMMGYGFIDVSKAFYDNPGWNAVLASNTLMSDSLHPTDAGYEVWNQALQPYFRKDSTARAGGVSRQSTWLDPPVDQIAPNPYLTQTVEGTIDGGWTISGATVTRETSIYETNGYSARISASGAAASSIQIIIDDAEFEQYKGQWVTMAMRVYMPFAGIDGSTAQPMDHTANMRGYAVADYSTYTQLRSTAMPVECWHWRVLSMYVPKTSTALWCTIYAGDGAYSNARIYVDRVSIVPGIIPRDVIPLSDNPNIATLASLTPTTDNFIVATASQWASRTPTQARTQMGLGTIATLSTITLTSNVTGILPAANGGTGNGFTAFTGPASTTKTFTLPNVTSTILTSNAAVTVAQGGTGRATSTTAYGLLAAGTTATGAHQTLAAGLTTQLLVGGGASALPVWTTATGSGSPVRATSPALVTPDLGIPSALTLTNATGLPVSTGISGLAANIAAFLATPSSANLATAVTDETGSGALVFGTSPNITTPTGIVKGDVGLGNVDNTSNATERAATATLTNKRITKRVVAVTQNATPTSNTDNADVFSMTALAQAVTDMSTNQTGTPADGDSLIWRITDDGTGRALAWGAKYENGGLVTLPATTVASTMLVVGFIWNTVTSKWRCVAVA
jgi:lysophospholipase L1-like esterase